MPPPSNYRNLESCRQANNSPGLPTAEPHSLPLLCQCDNASSNASLAHEKEADGGGGGGGEGWTSLCCMAQTTESPLAAIDASGSRAPPPQPPTTGYQLNLEMCTETLGCETGAAYAPGDFPMGASFSTSRSADKSIPDSTDRAMEERKASKRRTPSEFPPPLTTLFGEGCFRLSSRRVEGRLLLMPFKPSIMEAERRDGRLCLRLFRDDDVAASIATVEKEETDAGAGDHKSQVDKEGSGCDGNVGDEGGIGKYKRAGHCKEEEGGGGPGTRRERSNVILRYSVASFLKFACFCAAVNCICSLL